MSYADLQHVAFEAADLAAELFQARQLGRFTNKGDRDYATEADYFIEQQVQQHLAERCPNIGFVGEENGPETSTADRWWVLDPIDGTINFAHGLPLCGVSLALIEDSRAVLGVIDFPLLETRYTATKGEGAWCGDDKLQVSDTTRIDDALITIGDYAVGDHAEAKNEKRLHLTRLLAGQALRVRMLGSAALDLAWLAHGNIDASITLSNNAWDVSAGVIIAREAGAHVFDIDGSPHDLASTATIAAGPQLAPHLLDLLKPLRDIR